MASMINRYNNSTFFNIIKSYVNTKSSAALTLYNKYARLTSSRLNNRSCLKKNMKRKHPRKPESIFSSAQNKHNHPRWWSALYTFEVEWHKKNAYPVSRRFEKGIITELCTAKKKKYHYFPVGNSVNFFTKTWPSNQPEGLWQILQSQGFP